MKVSDVSARVSESSIPKNKLVSSTLTAPCQNLAKHSAALSTLYPYSPLHPPFHNEAVTLNKGIAITEDFNLRPDFRLPLFCETTKLPHWNMELGVA